MACGVREFSIENSRALWGSILSYFGNWNKNAGVTKWLFTLLVRLFKEVALACLTNLELVI